MSRIFDIYKRGQGKYSRALGIAGIGGLAVFGAYSLYESLQKPPFNEVLQNIPGLDMKITWSLIIMIGCLLATAVGLYWLNNRPKVVDFLIETEGELRKVTWPTRDEVIGSSIVVVITVFIMGAFIFLCDIALKFLMTDIVYKEIKF